MNFKMKDHEPADYRRILDACHYDPFEVLGKHLVNDREVVRAYIPSVKQVSIVDGNLEMQRVDDTDLFEWQGPPGKIPVYYRLKYTDDSGNLHTSYDPYCFPSQLSDFDLHLFQEGKHQQAYCFLGAHPYSIENISGTRFAVWAPNAERVSVV